MESHASVNNEYLQTHAIFQCHCCAVTKSVITQLCYKREKSAYFSPNMI